MYRRKIQKTGGASLIVTLPKKWVERWKLQDKDFVALSTQSSGSLLIQSIEQVESNQRSYLDITNLTPEMVEREIFSRYLVGIDEIVIKSSSIPSTVRNNIRDISQSLLGLEIIDESASEILIKNIFDLSTLSPAETIEKIFRMAGAMFRDSLQAMRDSDKKLAHDVITRDLEVDKLQLIITRQFHSLLRGRLSEDQLQSNLVALNYYESIAIQLERIADHAAKISRSVVLAKRPLKKVLSSSGIIKTSDILLALLEKTAAMVTTADTTIAHSILDSNESLEKKINRIRIVTQHETYRGMVLEIGLDRLRGYIMNIAEMTIDYSLEK